LPFAVPLLVYALVAGVDTGAASVAVLAPGMLILAFFAAYSMYIGIRDKVPTMPFDIKEVGKTKDGQKVYSWRYKHDGHKGPIHMGLMAQEVERKNPEAVIEHGGIKFVNYGKALAGAK
jgi:TRAP-type mannitol/chloroaromatic compound transport system permease large subunit